MKHKVWLAALPVIVLMTFAFYVVEQGEDGSLHSAALRTGVFPHLRTVSGVFTNLKFRLRGPEAPKNKIAIVTIDSPSIEAIGRWPWHRNYTAFLIDKIFEAGAKVVGLDMVFSEEDRRVPEELADALKKKGLTHLLHGAETDPVLADTLRKHRDRVVLGWTTESACQPGYSAPEECPVTHPDAIKAHPAGYDRFAVSRVQAAPGFDPQTTPLMSLVTMIANLPSYNSVARHAGYFNAFPDPDGYIRRTSLLVLANGKAYPSLPLEMARIGMGDELEAVLSSQGKLDALRFANLDYRIPVTQLGTLEINFRGPSYTYPYVSALEMMQEGEAIHTGMNRELASTKSEVLRDAYVLIGVSALGVFDMRSFAFDSNTPGVEGHATILDNLLSADFLKTAGSSGGRWILYLLMTLGAVAFAYATGRLESVPALVLFAAVFAGLTWVDVKVLFSKNLNWNTGFLYLEVGMVFLVIMALKYILEERNKKFIKGAFAKYVSPAIIDSVLKDPTKLTVGGEKRDLTILFSDIRGFTTLSERMDAKHLAGFLNDYLGTMTDIVFETEGTLDKYIGDAVMAFWGAPLESTKHAQNACKAAAKMLQKLAEERPRYLKEYGVDVQIGIGINSGTVNVGNMGSDKIFEYTVIGDSVNLASRLEGLTKYYGAGIVTSRFTLDQIAKAGEPVPPHRVLDFVKVKGKTQAIELVQILERELSAEGLAAFENGRAHYQNAEWDSAIAAFRRANELLRPSPDREDGPSQVYIERCEELKLAPPPHWDGAWEMQSK